MLKWTVAAKRDNARRASTGRSTTPVADGEKSVIRRKRRHSTTSRRSSLPKRRSIENGLCLDANKENQFTSTPIKGSEDAFQPDAFRDLSNVTPKRHYSPKRKKKCINPAHGQEFLLHNSSLNYFRHFETVDSHIEGITVKGFCCGCDGSKTYAPTLPTFPKNCSPKRYPLLKFAEMCPPNKRTKIDHVNDFLQQISAITSAEDDERLPSSCVNEEMMSPLVKRLVDLQFKATDNSSFLNDLSIDKIVDAILDKSLERDNNHNESHEENLINTQQERSLISTDSGFKSNATTSFNNNNNITFIKQPSQQDFSRTIININETFNERCVDYPAEEFTLKRQRCIRKRRHEDHLKDNDLSFDSNATNAYDPQETHLVDKRFHEELRGSGRSSIDLEVRHDGGVGEGLAINVFRCVNLRRYEDALPVNAYVKVILSEKPDCHGGGGSRRRRGTLQRTAVQPESHSPSFDHVFRVSAEQVSAAEVLHVEVWHRERALRRSEFLGCVSFLIKDVINSVIGGTHWLLSQQHRGRPFASSSPVTVSPDTDDDHQQHQQNPQASAMCDSQSSIDEALAGDIDSELRRTPAHRATLTQQQKDADENLFLRYLELDPTEGPDSASAAAQRKAAGHKSNGRTPFTTTAVLRRPPKGGFGFSVVWTHPPRIERVEKGLSADKAGILPGDYIIFVDKHNVVMMPEVDILNLIKSFGNQLTLEIFRRSAASRNGSVPSVRKLAASSFDAGSTKLTASFDAGSTMGLPAAPPSTTTTTQRRPSTVCSTNTASVEYNRKKLHLPQVTFSSEKPTNSAEDARKKAMYQILTKEQQYTTSMQFAMARFVSALAERKDLIGPTEHRILFQNCDELLRISEDIVDNLVQEDGDYLVNLLLRTYISKLPEMTTAYKRYCCGIKKADCVLANVMKNSEFARFLQTPAIPRRRPDITVFIHKPLEHYREILKLFNVLMGHTKPNQEEYPVISQIVHELQVSYREITSEAGLMEPVGEGRPLLSVQDLENRLVFTKCKPFVLAKPGRQWIFGGDLSRVEGRTVRNYWALLFNDILLFAKVSRDRVLFILEDPLPLVHITDFFFNVRKKANEFRIIVEPGGRKATSPTVHCGPDLSRTPRKNPTKRCVVLRTPTVELKAVWQNLLQRQIFQVNAGMEGSSYSSPLESPEAPITSSVVTLQSAESLSIRRQTPRNINYSEKDQKKQIDELIEHKCKELERSSSSSKSNAIHLEQWMKGRFSDGASFQHHCTDHYHNNHQPLPLHQQHQHQQQQDGCGCCCEEDHLELWTEDMVRKRSEELRLIPASHNKSYNNNNNNGMSYANNNNAGSVTTDGSRSGAGGEETNNTATASDQDQSPSRSTNTTESQVTVRSSPLVPEAVNVCRQCHRTCVSYQNGSVGNMNYKNSANCINNNYNDNRSNINGHQHHHNHRNGRRVIEEEVDEDDWRPLMLMGLTAINPAATFVKLDPFAAPLPQISVLPPTPTPDLQTSITHNEYIPSSDVNCNCNHDKPQVGELSLNKDYADNTETPDDSPMNDEQPYHSLNSSNLTLRRFGTVSSLERFGSEDKEETYDVHEGSSGEGEHDFEEGEEEEEEEDVEYDDDEESGIDNEGFNHSAIRSWTARAGSFVAEKMAFFEKLGEDYRTGGRFFERYLKSEITVNGDEVQEEETSGATSGEEIWGTPTSGPEYDEPLSSPNYDGRNSPSCGGSLSSNEDTELMMDELLMTPPVTGASIRGLLPRRTLEPLMEEEYSDSYTSSSSTPTEPSVSPEQGNGTGDAADKCWAAAEERAERTNSNVSVGRAADRPSGSPSTAQDAVTRAGPPAAVAEPPIHRSESYRRIIEQEDDNVGFFTRFKTRPSMKFVNIERIPPAKGAKFLEFFNVRRERKIYETFPGGKHLIKVFSRENDFSDEVPTSYAEKPEAILRIKERQLDRRFWKQLSKRRGNTKPVQLSA